MVANPSSVLERSLTENGRNSSDESTNAVKIDDIPGEPTAFELCAKFCYGGTQSLFCDLLPASNQLRLLKIGLVAFVLVFG
ncbi:hypothetical protein L6452_38884 [Arctium lappa]|uniref:Uncharacterized protein n=1 Tax=Arctium lappa TaxID=4217 RepID=A0ACB8XRY2_ARCLA|nr:hypothetical protein L6452_38884 [Arctium lappa]